MKYALQGGTPDGHGDLTDAHLDRIASMGYQGLSFHFGAYSDPSSARPSDLSAEDRRRVRLMVHKHDLEFAYCWGYWAPLVSHDTATREFAVDLIKDSLRLAHDVDSRFVVTGPGSNDYRSGWYPHPANWTELSLDYLCSAVGSVADEAAKLDVTLSLKGHVLSTLNTPEILARAVEIVGSDHVIGSVDPVNQMPLEHAFEPNRMVDDLMIALGQNARIAHAKDYCLDPAMVISLRELPFGAGWLDVPYYIQRVDATMSDPWFVVEHVPDSDLEITATRLRQFKALALDQPYEVGGE